VVFIPDVWYYYTVLNNNVIGETIGNNMIKTDLIGDIALGEDSGRQFKADIRNADSLASEMAAFANSEGGTIYIGVADDGSVQGVDKSELPSLNQLISNAVSHLVRSPLTVRTENMALPICPF
jgi:ATP-dependent DNA helicase RecG